MGLRQQAWVFAVSVLSLVLLLVFGVFADHLLDVPRSYQESAYWFLWAHCLLLVLALLQDKVRQRLVDMVRSRQFLVLAGLAVVVTILMTFSVRGAYRVLADETNLIGTSLSLYLDQTARNIIEGQWIYHKFNIIRAEMPTRPLLFPFLMSLMHALFGFSPEHGFVVNALASAATLLTAAVFATRLISFSAGVLSILLLAAYPLFVLCTRAAGFEAVNLLFITLFGAQLWRFLHHPSGGEAQLLLILALLAGQGRYESAALLLPALLAMLVHLKTLWATPMPLTMGFFPLLLLPSIWQRSKSVAVNAGDVGKDAFPLAELPSHIGHALQYYLNWPDNIYASLAPVFVLALAGLAVAVYRSYRQFAENPSKLIFLGLMLSGLGIIALVQCAYYLGDMRKAFISRMGLSIVSFMTLAAVYAVSQPLRRWRRVGAQATVFVLAAALLAYGWMRSARNDHGRTLTLYREYSAVLAFLAREGGENALVIAERPSMYAARGLSAVSYNWARKNQKRLLRQARNKQFAAIYAIQHVKPGSNQVEKASQLELPMRVASVKPVWEIQNSERQAVRVARIELVSGRRVHETSGEPESEGVTEPDPAEKEDSTESGTDASDDAAGEGA